MISQLKAIGTAAYLGGLLAVPEEFCWAWGAMREFTTSFLCAEGEMVWYTRARFSLHAHARNNLVEAMHGDWLFMTDTDHAFPPETLYQLVTLQKRYQLPILSGVYRHKVLPHHPMLWRWSETPPPAGFVPIIEYDPEVPVFQVDAVGAGCLLIHKAVFAALAQRFPEEGPFDHIGKYGEDFSFCLRCREASIPIFATPLVESTHLRLQGLTPDAYVPEWFDERVQEDVAVAAAPAYGTAGLGGVWPGWESATCPPA